ncbi:hypothetical protein K492DRAFT_190893 [Lichtheimia hyalospora FSU 10163]|nr:hypothetical protein K492DRAFT_190893 [Lichtheimia hyalospora FSU 10163]
MALQKYHFYPSKSPTDIQVQPVDKTKLTQLVQFLNAVYCTTNLNPEVPLFPLANGAVNNELELLDVPAERKKSMDGNRQSVRSHFVLDPDYHPDVVKSISTILPKHQNDIQELKTAGCEEIGYVRKLNTTDTPEKR